MCVLIWNIFRLFSFSFLCLVSRGAFPFDEREHKQTRTVVVTCPSYRSSRNGLLADAPSQDILRNEKISIIPSLSHDVCLLDK